MGKDMIIVEMSKHFQTRALEWWSAACLASWGAAVLLIPGLFMKQQYMAFFQPLLVWAPQHVWGFFAFTMGLLRLMALTVNGFWYRTPQIRLLTAFLSTSVWFFIAAGLFQANAILGVVVYGWHMIADIYSSFRSAVDTVEAETQKRLRQLSHVAYEGSQNVHSISAG